MLSEFLARCIAISNANFLNAPYKDLEKEYYAGGISKRASEVCHYCTVSTLQSIINRKCLRFSDVRFLNDSTEFIEVIHWIRYFLSDEECGYSKEFQEFILNSKAMEELEKYHQFSVVYSKEEGKVEEKTYRTYTCSLSTDIDSLGMWNYYATSKAGVNIVFDQAWNMFEGSDETEVNSSKQLENGIIIRRGAVLYKYDDKKKCIVELLNSLQEIYEEAKEEIDTYQNNILSAFKQAVNNMRCFFKNEYFKSESEYRIVLNIPEDLLLADELESDIVEKGQFMRGNILIPFVDYHLKKESIKQIVINPFVQEKKEMFELGIKELLWKNQMEEAKVYISGIPIRDYN